MGKSKQQLSDEFDTLIKGAPAKFSKWQHSKSGGVYEVWNYCFLEKTLEFMVNYICLESGIIFCRPLAEWEQLVMPDDGRKVPRFVPWKEVKDE